MPVDTTGRGVGGSVGGSPPPPSSGGSSSGGSTLTREQQERNIQRTVQSGELIRQGYTPTSQGWVRGNVNIGTTAQAIKSGAYKPERQIGQDGLFTPSKFGVSKERPEVLAGYVAAYQKSQEKPSIGVSRVEQPEEKVAPQNTGLLYAVGPVGDPLMSDVTPKKEKTNYEKAVEGEQFYIGKVADVFEGVSPLGMASKITGQRGVSEFVASSIVAPFYIQTKAIKAKSQTEVQEVGTELALFALTTGAFEVGSIVGGRILSGKPIKGPVVSSPQQFLTSDFGFSSPKITYGKTKTQVRAYELEPQPQFTYRSTGSQPYSEFMSSEIKTNAPIGNRLTEFSPIKSQRDVITGPKVFSEQTISPKQRLYTPVEVFSTQTKTGSVNYGSMTLTLEDAGLATTTTSRFRTTYIPPEFRGSVDVVSSKTTSGTTRAVEPLGGIEFLSPTSGKPIGKRGIYTYPDVVLSDSVALPITKQKTNLIQSAKATQLGESVVIKSSPYRPETIDVSSLQGFSVQRPTKSTVPNVYIEEGGKLVQQKTVPLDIQGADLFTFGKGATRRTLTTERSYEMTDLIGSKMETVLKETTKEGKLTKGLLVDEGQRIYSSPEITTKGYRISGQNKESIVDASIFFRGKQNSRATTEAFLSKYYGGISKISFKNPTPDISIKFGRNIRVTTASKGKGSVFNVIEPESMGVFEGRPTRTTKPPKVTNTGTTAVSDGDALSLMQTKQRTRIIEEPDVGSTIFVREEGASFGVRSFGKSRFNIGEIFKVGSDIFEMQKVNEIGKVKEIPKTSGVKIRQPSPTTPEQVKDTRNKLVGLQEDTITFRILGGEPDFPRQRPPEEPPSTPPTDIFAFPGFTSRFSPFGFPSGGGGGFSARIPRYKPNKLVNSLDVFSEIEGKPRRTRRRRRK